MVVQVERGGSWDDTPRNPNYAGTARFYDDRFSVFLLGAGKIVVWLLTIHIFTIAWQFATGKVAKDPDSGIVGALLGWGMTIAMLPGILVSAICSSAANWAMLLTVELNEFLNRNISFPRIALIVYWGSLLIIAGCACYAIILVQERLRAHQSRFSRKVLAGGGRSHGAINRLLADSSRFESGEPSRLYELVLQGGVWARTFGKWSLALPAIVFASLYATILAVRAVSGAVSWLTAR